MFSLAGETKSALLIQPAGSHVALGDAEIDFGAAGLTSPRDHIVDQGGTRCGAANLRGDPHTGKSGQARFTQIAG